MSSLHICFTWTVLSCLDMAKGQVRDTSNDLTSTLLSLIERNQININITRGLQLLRNCIRQSLNVSQS